LIVLVVLLLVGVVGGVVAYIVFQYSGVGSRFPGAEPRLEPGASRARVRGSLVQRVEDAPQGCLWGAIVAMGVWIGLWVIVLILGLRVLLA
jgi:hypothetical protein